MMSRCMIKAIREFGTVRSFTRVLNDAALTAMLLLAVAVVPSSRPMARPSDQKTEIRVQVMDSHTHRPLKHRKVQITFSGMDGQWYHNAPWMIGRTGSDGVADFQFKGPAPPRISVFVWWVYPCSTSQDFLTQTILKDGVVAYWTHSGIKKSDRWCTADSQASQPQRQPGRVVVFIHPLNRFQYAWYDTWKSFDAKASLDSG